MTDRPLSDDIFFIGHSLVGHDIPSFIEDFIGSTGGSGTVDKRIANGAPLKYQWENPGAGQGTNAMDALSSGTFEAIVLAEAVPLRNHLEWSGSIDYAAQFAEMAVNANPGTQIYVYEMWHSLNSGTGATVPWDDYGHVPWRDRLDDDLALWESIVDGVNTRLEGTGAPDAVLIPVGQAFANLYDAIEAGSVPGISSISDFFEDDIHTNDLGDYFVSLVQYATIFGADAAELAALPTTVEAAWWREVSVPSELAQTLKTLTAETVAEYTVGTLVPEPMLDLPL